MSPLENDTKKKGAKKSEEGKVLAFAGRKMSAVVDPTFFYLSSHHHHHYLYYFFNPNIIIITSNQSYCTWYICGTRVQLRIEFFIMRFLQFFYK